MPRTHCLLLLHPRDIDSLADSPALLYLFGICRVAEWVYGVRVICRVPPEDHIITRRGISGDAGLSLRISLRSVLGIWSHHW